MTWEQYQSVWLFLSGLALVRAQLMEAPVFEALHISSLVWSALIAQHSVIVMLYSSPTHSLSHISKFISPIDLSASSPPPPSPKDGGKQP